MNTFFKAKRSLKKNKNLDYGRIFSEMLNEACIFYNNNINNNYHFHLYSTIKTIFITSLSQFFQNIHLSLRNFKITKKINRGNLNLNWEEFFIWNWTLNFERGKKWNGAKWNWLIWFIFLKVECIFYFWVECYFYFWWYFEDILI